MYVPLVLQKVGLEIHVRGCATLFRTWYVRGRSYRGMRATIENDGHCTQHTVSRGAQSQFNGANLLIMDHTPKTRHSQSVCQIHTREVADYTRTTAAPLHPPNNSSRLASPTPTLPSSLEAELRYGQQKKCEDSHSSLHLCT